jgi:cell division protein FtsN
VKAPAPKPAAPAVAAESTPAAPKIAQATTPKAAPDHNNSNSAANSFYVQAGAYATQSRADQAAAALDSLGARVQPATVDGHAIFRVRIGPFLDIGQANAAVSHAQALGHTDLRIISE